MAASIGESESELAAIVDDLSPLARISDAAEQKHGKPILGQSVGRSIVAFQGE